MPLISYYGGKQRIASKIVPHLQAIPHTVRSIPFAGGLGVFYSWPVPSVTNGDHYREAINDHDELLILLYRVAREKPEEFERIIQLTPYSQAEYRRSREILKTPDSYDLLDKAWAYFVNINCSFANKLNGGWATQTIKQNTADTWRRRQAQLPSLLKRLDSVYIGCEDALVFIKRWDSPHTLHYLDPPYPGTEMGHYGGYTLDDYQNLCDLLDDCQGSYVLSNYPQDIEPKSAQCRVEIKTVMSAAKVKGGEARTEVLWICDRSSGIRKDLAKHSGAMQTSLFQ